MKLLSGLGLVAVSAAVLGFAGRRPPAALPVTAPDTVFAGMRAMAHVRAIAERPHPPGSADHARVRGSITAELTRLGLEPMLQEATAVSTRFPAAGHVINILARLSGKTPGKAVLLAAHYDGVPAAPAAGDDGSGSAVLLEVARALRAGPPLEHDVILLFTDGEEAGLLGAAAFVREHPWARDVEVMLNFEARGTGGQAVMFQTGPGNLDQVRELRRLPGLSATSLTVTVYRLLPNDTDLSELFALGKPALNFAFIDGVERYHTSEDDPAHLEPGSLQQEGTYALALTRTFANGPLPRARTGDAIFFDLPLVGLVAYPEGWAWPLAIAALALLVVTAVRVARRERRRWLRGLMLGIAGLIVSLPLAGGLAYLAVYHGPVGAGSPGWRMIYGVAIACLAIGAVAVVLALLRRWADTAGLHLAGLTLWAGLALLVTAKAPGASFLFIWPLGVALAAASVTPSGNQPAARAARWIAAVVSLALVLPVARGIGVDALGVVGIGGVAIGIIAALLAWLLLPHLDRIAGDRRWLAALLLLALGGLGVGIARAGGQRAADRPTRSMLAYAIDAEGDGAWLATIGRLAPPGSWEAGVLGSRLVRIDPGDSLAPAKPAWLGRVFGRPLAIAAAPVARVPLAPPEVTVLSDSTAGGGRVLALRLRAAGSLSLGVRAVNTRVLSASLDGRPIDPTRYRRPEPGWRLELTAPPDSGFVLSLTVPPSATPELELVAQSAGLPADAGLVIPPRPANVLPSQTGDVSVVRRRVRLDGR